MAKKKKKSESQQENMQDTQTNTTLQDQEQQERLRQDGLDAEGVEKTLEELEATIEEQKDKYLRLYAEFENFKKRNVREKLDLMRSAAQDTLAAILPVLDDFDRAKQVSEDPETQEHFSEGVKLVYNRLYQVLQNQGLTQMESTGQPFDPDLHEAVTEIPAPSKELKGKVIDTIEKGYYLNDKIIRHAKVVVGK